MALTAFGVIDGATFSLLQLCQVTVAVVQQSLMQGVHCGFQRDQGSSGNHALALKWLFNVGSSICSNSSGRFLHQWSSQNKIFIKKKSRQWSWGVSPHHGEQLSTLPPGQEANLCTCWEASLASQTFTVCPVHYKLDSQSAHEPAGVGLCFVWLCTNSAFSSCFLFTSRRGWVQEL